MPNPMPNNLNIVAGVGSAALAYFAAVDTPGAVGAAGTAGVQTVTITGTPTGGTFALTWNGYTTVGISYNASAAAVQTALNALPHGSLITVAGSAGGPYTVTFPATIPQVVMTATGNFTGGTSPSIAVVNTTPGVKTTTPATAAQASILSTGAPATGFLCAGYVEQSGLTANVQETANQIKGYGTTQVLRVTISESSRSFDLSFLETNPVVSTIYERMPWGTVTADAEGHWAISQGPAVVQTYAGIFLIVDGLNLIYNYCPRLQVSAIKAQTVSAGKEIMSPVTLMALPDANGNAVYKDIVVGALAS